MINGMRWHRASALSLWRLAAISMIAFAAAAHPISASAQTKPGAKPTTRKPAPAPPRKPTVAPAEMTCPSPLGAGVKTQHEYCDVLTGRDPKEGILIKLPPHRGPVTLRFNLHNRHTYSEEEVRLKRGFASYAAGIGVLTLDNTLLSRAAVATEFRTAADLLERITGGAGPGGVKAVAPVGSEAISLELPGGVVGSDHPWREADRGARRRPAGHLHGERAADRHRERRNCRVPYRRQRQRAAVGDALTMQ